MPRKTLQEDLFTPNTGTQFFPVRQIKRPANSPHFLTSRDRECRDAGELLAKNMPEDPKLAAMQIQSRYMALKKQGYRPHELKYFSEAVVRHFRFNHHMVPLAKIFAVGRARFQSRLVDTFADIEHKLHAHYGAMIAALRDYALADFKAYLDGLQRAAFRTGYGRKESHIDTIFALRSEELVRAVVYLEGFPSRNFVKWDYRKRAVAR